MLLHLFAALCHAALADFDDTNNKAELTLIKLRESTADVKPNTQWCPTQFAGTQCPAEQVLKVAIVVLPIACVLPLVAALLYRLCCRPVAPQQPAQTSSSFVAPMQFRSQPTVSFQVVRGLDSQCTDFQAGTSSVTLPSTGSNMDPTSL